MSFSFFVLFLCLPGWAGRELNAQFRYENPQQAISETFNNIVAPIMSENGTWLTLRKRSFESAWDRSDLDKDTIMIFDIRNPEKIRLATTRQEIRNMSFIGNAHLLLSGAKQTELLNLEEQKGIFFKGVKQARTLKNSKAFILHYNEEEKSRLELRNIRGELLNSLNNVSHFNVTENEHIYAITGNKHNEYQIFLLKNNLSEKVYNTANKIVSFNVDPGEHGIVIREQYNDNLSRDILYLDAKAGTPYPLKDILPVEFESGECEMIREEKLYFLRLRIHKDQKDSMLVDIWYGSDNQLEEKFSPSTREVHYLWEPEKKQIQRIGSDALKNNVNIGNDRYFISYNPYQLQDYTKSTKFRIMIYDRLKNLYALMDTIPGELYVSPDGQYVLYSKSKTWHIYQMATGTIKVFGDKNLQTPYFTRDKKIILFTGVGGLWQYDVEKNRLSTTGNFKEAEVTILNNSARYSPGGNNFFQNTVDHTKPLVIRLYNSGKNENTYLLWYNGIYETIIPSTTKYIRSLSYNDTYQNYSYIEENYNMPPRLVYTTFGKKEKIIYQSNREDTSVLSLKQEIISYTNSNNINLKGILYYPLNFIASKKYPMVVHIYQVQSKERSNNYPVIVYGRNNNGFNLRLLLEKGYFVYFPDIVYGAKGTGLSALDCVNHALDAIENNPFIDKNEIGLIGHSHGGYETNFIATHSNRFATYVSGAGNSDIIRSYFSFNYNFLFPFYRQYEDGQYEMKTGFSENKDLYFQNNPIHFVDRVNAPVLLWTGMKDRNIDWEQTMEFYIGLKRSNKKVIALFYPNEAHTIFDPKACRDLMSRISEWFDYFLKGDENVDWINEEIRK